MQLLFTVQQNDTFENSNLKMLQHSGDAENCKQGNGL